jgi:hypothetical protein
VLTLTLALLSHAGYREGMAQFLQRKLGSILGWNEPVKEPPPPPPPPLDVDCITDRIIGALTAAVVRGADPHRRCCLRV